MKKICLDTNIIKESSKILTEESTKCKNYINEINVINDTIREYYSSSNSDLFHTQTKTVIGKLIKDSSFMENYGKTLQDIENGVLDKENEYQTIYNRNRQEFGDIEDL